MVSEARPVCQQISQFDEIRVSIGNVILVKVGLGVKLVSKELNNFGAIAAFFRDWALRTLTGST